MCVVYMNKEYMPHISIFQFRIQKKDRSLRIEYDIHLVEIITTTEKERERIGTTVDRKRELRVTH